MVGHQLGGTLVDWLKLAIGFCQWPAGQKDLPVMMRRLWLLAAVGVFCRINGERVGSEVTGGADGGEEGGDSVALGEPATTVNEDDAAVDNLDDAIGSRWFIQAALATSNMKEERLEWSYGSGQGISVCSLDHVGVELLWNSTQEIDKSALWELVLLHDQGRDDVVASDMTFPSATAIQDRSGGDAIEVKSGHSSTDTTAALECEFDPDYCHPELVGILLPDLPDQHALDETDESHFVSPLKVNDSIVLEFKAPTNRPEVGSISDVNAIVTFSEYLGDNFTGNWSLNGRFLILRVLEVDKTKLKPARLLMNGLLATTLVGHQHRGVDATIQHSIQRAEYNLKLNFRIERPSTYQIRVHESNSVGVSSLSILSPILHVLLCDKSDIILQDESALSRFDSHHRVLYEFDAKAEPASMYSTISPTLFIRGVLTVGSNENFIVPESALRSVEGSNAGSWSISMWVLLTEDSTGSFRTLFFHGDGSREQRTPSVWWKPNERRLVLRVSTVSDPDVGLDSAQELPLLEWVHLAFSFYNCSGAGNTDLNGGVCTESRDNPGAWYYVIEFYVNGELDQRVRVHEEVQPNNGPLHIGKDPWTSGMQGFISDLRVYDTPMRQDQHRQVYLGDLSNYPRYATDDAEDTDPLSLDQVDITPVSQIAYILQTVLTTPLEHINSVDENSIQSLIFDCSEGAADELDELAESGNSLALLHLGKSYLYGIWSGDRSCNSSNRVDQDVSKSATFLLKALRRGQLVAARYLALALEVMPTAYQVEDVKNPHLIELAHCKLGLYHIAASAGSKASFAILGNLYRLDTTLSGQGPELHAVAAHHYYHAARDASAAFHERGKQPLHEMNRLYDYRDSEGEEDLTARGERGENDELIQYQQLRADQGDVESMVAMGDLYYWGARGVQRDHNRAFHYFERAAHEGHSNSQCAVANMLLRGEGVKLSQRDNETAIAWYKKAIDAENHPRALNGLGYLHFHGSAGLPQNKTKALALFERAANEQRDGDSMFNAGYCYARGIGTTRNMTRAIELFDLGARKFGHFDSVMELAGVWMHGIYVQPSEPEEVDLEVVESIGPDWTRALEYSKVASDVGRWGSKMRIGFSFYLEREWGRAIIQYHDAQEFGGYPFASANLAFLYDMLARKSTEGGKDVVPLMTQLQKEQRAMRYLLLTHDINDDQEVLVRLGDYFFNGLAGIEANYRKALEWYSRASARGDDRGAYNVGYMYENGIGDVGVNYARAKRYYERSGELAGEFGGSQFAVIPARLAFYRVILREWTQESGIVHLLLALLGRGPHLNDSTTQVGTVAATGVLVICFGIVARRYLRFL